jgi:hypothetical protein
MSCCFDLLWSYNNFSILRWRFCRKSSLAWFLKNLAYTTFFLNRGRSQRDLEAFIKQWHNYKEDQKEKRDYKQAQTFCTTDLESHRGNAIGSSSNATASTRLDAVKHNAAGDMATWGEVPGANYIGAEGPPNRHRSLEV